MNGQQFQAPIPSTKSIEDAKLISGALDTLNKVSIKCQKANDAIASGNKVPDKLVRAGFHTIKSQHVNAPLIEELPMAVECELVSYDQESNFLVGNIINVSADESILTDGKIDIAKLQPITYDPVNHGYYTIGEKAGNAFADGKQLKEK